MKKMITILALIASFSAFSAEKTDCYTDVNGNVHCTTYDTRSDDITPKGAW
jgi:hypothetical protein